MAEIYISEVMFIFGMYFLISVNCKTNGDGVGMTAIGTAISGFSPCPDRFIFMERESGRSPSKDNYWKGTFNLSEFKILEEARIILTLDTDAIITLDGENNKVSETGLSNNFTIPVIPNKQEYVNFEVNAPANKPFPNIVSALFNGQRVCDNPESWHPDIQAVAGRAEIGNGTFPSTNSLSERKTAKSNK